MADNLPDNLSDVEDEYIVGEDSRAMQLTHYVLAERLLQVEYAEIMRQHREEKDSQSLIYILEGGFRGFHKMTAGELWSEWKDGAENKWYELYQDNELPWEAYEDDPIHKLEEETEAERKDRVLVVEKKAVTIGEDA